MVTPESARPEIVLAVRNDDLRARLRGALAGCGHVQVVDALGPENPVDVLITDSPSESLDDFLPNRIRVQQPMGVVRIGHGSGDVVLPGDFSDRELTTACRLLAEVVRLRRGHRDAVRSGREYRQLALTDALTKLPNRRAREQELAARLSGAASSPSPSRGHCLALIDLDHFAEVNGNYGYAAGDDILRATAAAMQSSVRDEDLVARIGGDEFALLATTVTPAAAEQLCERLRCAIVAQLAERAPCPMTASVGGTWSTSVTPETADTLYKKTSAALKQAKQAGRDRTVLV